MFRPMKASTLETIFNLLESGNPNDDEINAALKSYNQMAKIANDRMRRLEKSGLAEYSAYNAAANVLANYDRTRFPQFNAKTLEENYEEFRAYARQARRFTASKLSTVGEVKKYEQRTADFWYDNFKSAGGYTNMNERKAKETITALNRNGLLRMAELYGSEFVRESIDFVSGQHNSVNELLNRIEQVQHGRRLYANLFN